MKIGQAILTDKNKILSGKFTKIGIQTSNGLGEVRLEIDGINIVVTPLTHIYELEGIEITEIKLPEDFSATFRENDKVIIDYIGEVSSNG